MHMKHTKHNNNASILTDIAQEQVLRTFGENDS